MRNNIKTTAKVSVILLILSIGWISKTFIFNRKLDIYAICHSLQSEYKVKSYIDNDTLFLFLPSFANIDKVYLKSMWYDNISIDDKPYNNEVIKKLCNSSIDQVLSVKVSRLGIKVISYKLRILKSENIPSIFIETQSHDLTKINNNKNAKDKALISIISKDGNILYINKNYDMDIKGRGNSTWILPKKPYQIRLSSKEKLLGMPSAKKWVLLANAYDESNLRNKIIFDFAENAEQWWTPHANYVDLYINNEYRGIYLLSEKVEVKKNRLNCKQKDDIILFQQTSPYQALIHDNKICTEIGCINLLIEYPHKISNKKKRLVKELSLHFENIILNNIKSDKYSIDVDSWCRKYLIDEIFGNSDANACSSYFFSINQGGRIKFYGGPIWDYDKAIGNTSILTNPTQFSVRREWKSNTHYTPYYNAIYNNPEFFEHIAKLYEFEYKPKLRKLIESDIEKNVKIINKANAMNSLRWKEMFADTKESKNINRQTYNEIIEYLCKRIQILDKQFIEREKMYLISYEEKPNDFYRYLLIDETQTNNLQSIIPSPTRLGYRTIIWRDKKNDSIYDFRKPINKDITLYIDTLLSQKL